MLIPNIKTSQLDPEALEIANAAMVYLIRTGRAELNVGQLTGATDISRATLYRHFASRDALYATLLYANQLELNERIRIWQAEKSGRQILFSFLQYSIESIKKARVLARLELVLKGNEKVADLYGQTVRLKLRNQALLTQIWLQDSVEENAVCAMFTLLKGLTLEPIESESDAEKQLRKLENLNKCCENLLYPEVRHEPERT